MLSFKYSLTKAQNFSQKSIDILVEVVVVFSDIRNDTCWYSQTLVNQGLMFSCAPELQINVIYIYEGGNEYFSDL